MLHLQLVQLKCYIYNYFVKVDKNRLLDQYAKKDSPGPAFILEGNQGPEDEAFCVGFIWFNVQANDL